MAAKHQPTTLHCLGALRGAALLGGATGSFAVFWIALVALLTAGRPSGDRRRSIVCTSTVAAASQVRSDRSAAALPLRSWATPFGPPSLFLPTGGVKAPGKRGAERENCPGGSAPRPAGLARHRSGGRGEGRSGQPPRRESGIGAPLLQGRRPDSGACTSLRGGRPQRPGVACRTEANTRQDLTTGPS
jgi:hypothetical protein